MRKLVLSLMMAAMLAAALTEASAQSAVPPTQALTRLRGTIEQIDGRTLRVNARSGAEVSLPLSPQVTVGIVAPGSIEDIRPGLYVGAAGIPQPDGTVKALEIHIFADSLRGMAEGTMPWDSGPGSSMTNGTIGDVVGTLGRNITVRYGSEEKKIVVPPNTPVVTDNPGTEAALVAGAKVIVFVTHSGDGKAMAARILVGKDGLVPPM